MKVKKKIVVVIAGVFLLLLIGILIAVIYGAEKEPEATIRKEVQRRFGGARLRDFKCTITLYPTVGRGRYRVHGSVKDASGVEYCFLGWVDRTESGGWDASGLHLGIPPRILKYDTEDVIEPSSDTDAMPGDRDAVEVEGGF